MKALESFGQPNPDEIRRQITALRNEIALAENKRVGLNTAIQSRQQRLARLEAQLVLTSPVLSARQLLANG